MEKVIRGMERRIPAKEINVASKAIGSRFNIFLRHFKFKTANNLFEINEHNDWHPDLLVELFEKVEKNCEKNIG
jgi:hypothetical protein